MNAHPALRVLELASPATAPCGRLLAEAGCDVIKLEPPEGSLERRLPPLIGPSHRRTSAYALFHDTGKRGITLDIRAVEGKQLFLKLLDHIDVIIEGFPPGELSRVGLSYESLTARNPGLVFVSITPFGQDGPYGHFRGNDLVVFAMGGVMFISGEPGYPPVVAPNHQAYISAGTHAALAALAALWARPMNGRGDWIDVSIFECFATQENTITNYLGPGDFARRNGSQHRTALPGRIFACQDGYVHIFVSREEIAWKRFLAWIGHPPELKDEALAEINTRWRYAELVNSVTERFLRQRTRAELFESAQENHLPCVPVNTPAEFLNDPQTVYYKPIIELSHPDFGSYRTLRPPLPLMNQDTLRHAPRPGEHNQDVYKELIGLSAEDLEITERLKLYRSGQGPLSGIRVCAFTHVAAGPYATLQLAYLGAEVIKVESSTRIDYWRYRDRNDDPEGSRPFADHNKNTRSVTINLKQAEGIKLAHRLACASDVVIDNFTAGVMDKLGLGFEQLKTSRSDIIVVHMTGLGASGPRSRYVTYGPSLMSFCGMTYLWNHPDQETPVGSQASYPDYLAGVYAAYAIVAALHRRQHNKEPQLLDLSQAMVLASSMGPSYIAILNGPDNLRPQGNVSPINAPHNCYPCKGGDDAWCVIAVDSEQQWERLKEAMGYPDWAEADSFATMKNRLENREELDRQIANWTHQRTPRELMMLCQERGVPAGMVATGEDLYFDSHLEARGFLLEQEHKRMGKLRLPGPPVRFQNHPLHVWRFGPLLGEDNDYVLKEVLGLSDEEIRRYAECGVLT